MPKPSFLGCRYGAAEAISHADRSVRLIFFGGPPMDGPRHVWSSFVSSSTDRIERAKLAWKNGRFPKVLRDDEESIPLPEA
jgi:redox-sensitive bicupin YhaK (pirin superfamily)